MWLVDGDILIKRIEREILENLDHRARLRNVGRDRVKRALIGPRQKMRLPQFLAFLKDGNADVHRSAVGIVIQDANGAIKTIDLGTGEETHG